MQQIVVDATKRGKQTFQALQRKRRFNVVLCFQECYIHECYLHMKTPIYFFSFII